MANFEHPRGVCSLFASPAGLSPFLRFGCLSCRVFYYNLRELYMKVTSDRHKRMHISRGVSRTIPHVFRLIIPHSFVHIVCSLSLVFLSCVSVAVLHCPCSDSYCGESFSTRRPPSTQTLTAWKETPSVSRFGNPCCQSWVIDHASFYDKPINTRNAAECPFNVSISS